MKNVPRDLKAKSGRPSHSDLAAFVETLPLPARMLGLTHVTSSYLLRDIIAAGRIHVFEPCSVLGEPLTYAFYGRAAFRGANEFLPTNLSCLFPSILILDPKKVPPPKYVFAFDSGAFVGGMMDQYLHPYMPLFDFLLAPTPLSAARIVNAIFDTNEDFFLNRPSKTLAVPNSNFEAECFRQIISGGGRGDVQMDDRATTPELLFSEPIDLKECVQAAVLPDTLANDSRIGGALKEFGIKIYEYPWTGCSRPVENHFVVRQLIQSIYGDLNWL